MQVVHQKSSTGAVTHPTLTAIVRAAVMFGILAGVADTATATPRVDPSLIAGSLQTVAGGPPPAAHLAAPVALTVAPDDGLYIVDAGRSVVRRVAADGSITTVAGTGTAGRSPDGHPATASQLAYPVGIAVAPDGTVYVADTDSHRIRTVGPDGVLSTVAGTDGPGYGGDGVFGGDGDGGPATRARLGGPFGLAVALDGTLYIADAHNDRIRRIGPEGTITTVLGGARRPGAEAAPAARAWSPPTAGPWTTTGGCSSPIPAMLASWRRPFRSRADRSESRRKAEGETTTDDLKSTQAQDRVPPAT